MSLQKVGAWRLGWYSNVWTIATAPFVGWLGSSWPLPIQTRRLWDATSAMIRVRMEVGPNRHRRSARLFAEHVSSSLLRDFRRKPSCRSAVSTRVMDEKRDRFLSGLSLSRISNIGSSKFSCALSFQSRADSLHRLPSPTPPSILLISFRMTFTTL